MKFTHNVLRYENVLCRAVQERSIKRMATLVVLSFAVLSTSIATGQGTIGFVVDDDAVIDGLFDVAWANRLQDQGFTVVPLPVSYDPTQGDAADADVFIVSNDIASGDFVVGGISPEVEFFGFEGSTWFGGGGMNAGFAGGPPRLFNLNPIDASGQNNVALTISVAARTTGWDFGQDFVTFNLDVDGDNIYETNIADFQPNDNGDMQDTISELALDENFQDLIIPLGGIETIRLQIDAFSTANAEQIGIDNIRITGSNGAVVATENFEGGDGQIGFTAVGQGGAGGAFWDLVTPGAPSSSPRLSDRRPIITYENALYDELGMSATGDRFDGTTIDIENPSHPLAAGLSGTVQIYDFPQGITEMGDPISDDLEVIASNFGAPVIAVLERGEPDLNGNPSPGQRIAVFAFDGGDPDSYTNDGWTLLDLSVFYALTSSVTPGDFNGDGALDVNDVDALVGEIIAGTNNPDFDVTGDGNVNDSDLNGWLADAALANGFAEPYLLGDSDLDGSVNAADLNNVGLSWQQSPNTWSGADFTADGIVNAADLNVLGLNWQSTIALAAASAVPEPSSGSLIAFLLAAGGLLGWRQRRSPTS